MKWLYLFCLPFLVGCSTAEKTGNESEPENGSVSVPRIEIDQMEIEVAEIQGIAANRKGGAVVISNADQEHYWIEGLDSWPDSLLNAEVLVKGILEERNDAPVFIDTSEIKSQGIPVGSPEEAEKAAKRLWITKATYKKVN